MRAEALEEAIARLPGYGGVERTIPLATLGAGVQANSRFQSVVRVQVEPELARSWRVTLGTPQLENARALPTQTAGAGARTPAGFPTEWPDYNTSSTTITARLQWGHGGAMFEAWLDWRNGCSFVVHGSDVEVMVCVGTAASAPNNIGTPIATALVKYSAAITPDDSPSPHVSPSTLTFYLGGVGAAGNGVVAVPPFARAVRVFTNGPLDPAGPDSLLLSAELAQGTSYMQTRYTPSVANPGAGLGDAWLLPANTRWLRVTNESGLNTYEIAFEFLLDLG